MSQLDELLKHYIQGERGYWYYQLDMGTHCIQNGYFTDKRAAQKALKADVLKLVDRSIAVEFLGMRQELNL